MYSIDIPQKGAKMGGVVEIAVYTFGGGHPKIPK
jgi:hypothetical protein